MEKLSQKKAKHEVKAAAVSLCRTFIYETNKCLLVQASFKFRVPKFTWSMSLSLEAIFPSYFSGKLLV